MFAEEGAELWEPWMRLVDELLEDEKLLDAVYDAQGKRHSQSRTRGRFCKVPNAEEIIRKYEETGNDAYWYGLALRATRPGFRSSGPYFLPLKSKMIMTRSSANGPMFTPGLAMRSASSRSSTYSNGSGPKGREMCLSGLRVYLRRML